MFRAKISLYCLILLFSVNVCANNLIVSLKGELPEAAKSNILSYLGQLPNTELERSTFIYSAKENANQALQALGYYQATIDVKIEKTPWKITLAITLNDVTIIDNLDIKITGPASEDPKFIQLLNNHNIFKGDALRHDKYEQLKSDLISLALSRGYFNGELTESKMAIKDKYQYADITIHYLSGPRFQFGDIKFDNFSLEPDLLNSLIPFQKGEYYSATRFHKLQNQLQATQYFGSVLAVPDDKIEDNTQQKFTVPISVSLAPAKSHLFDLGIGYATDTQFRFSAGWRTPLINKYGHFQETKLEYSKINPTGKFIYSIPLDHPINDLLQLKMTVENDDYEDLTTKFFSAQVGRVVRKNKWQREIYTRYHQEDWHYELDDTKPNTEWDVLDAASYIIPGITWSKTERTGSPLDPSHGFRQTYNVEGAHEDAGSDNTFFSLHGRWNYITTLKANHRLVTRAELGAVFVDRDAELAPSLLFYAGGDQSIRGFAYQSIGVTIPSSSDPTQAVPIIVGGTRLVVASVEYQYYLNNKWRVALFSDGGSVANKGEFNPVYSLGTGLHYMSPVGAIKIDFAYGIDGDEQNWRVHINLGAEL